MWVSTKTEQRCADSPLEAGTQVLVQTLEGKAGVRPTRSPMPQAFGLHAFRCLDTHTNTRQKNVPVSITSENWRSEHNSKRSAARKNGENRRGKRRVSANVSTGDEQSRQPHQPHRRRVSASCRGLRSIKRAESKLRLHQRNGITKRQGGLSLGKMLAFFSTCVP